MEVLQNHLQKSINDGVLPSLAILAKRKDGTVIVTKYLDRQPTPWSSHGAIDDQTAFILASCTKLPTTVAALHLVERGLVRLDDDVSSRLPTLARQQVLRGWTSDGLPILKDRKNPITLCHLLTHSAGTGYEFQSKDLRKFQQWRGISPNPGSTIDERFDHPLLFEPGEGWAYGCGIDWAGKLVEELSGISLEEYLNQHVWRPLGVSSFTFFPKSRDAANYYVATLAKRNESTGLLEELPSGLNLNIGLADCFGGQGAYCNASDYMKLLYSVLANDGRVLQMGTVEMMFQPQLSQASKAALTETMSDPAWAVGDFYRGETYDWGLGGLLIDGAHGSGAPFTRGSTTLVWSGIANLFWFIDRDNGLCGLFVTQMLPGADPQIRELIEVFQEAVYRLSN